MQYRIRLLDNSKNIADKINKVLLKEIEVKVATFSSAIKKDLPKVLIESIKRGDVYRSLTVGGGIGSDLRAEFGFSKSSHTASDIDEIIEAVVGEVTVTSKNIKAGSSGISGKIRIEAINKDLNDALTLPQTNTHSKDLVLPWFEWLSFDGDSIIISEHNIIYGNFNRTTSRSGKALMRKSRGFWKVPSGFSGTRDNNWITRAVDKDNARIAGTITSLMNGIL